MPEPPLAAQAASVACPGVSGGKRSSSTRTTSAAKASKLGWGATPATSAEASVGGVRGRSSGGRVTGADVVVPGAVVAGPEVGGAVVAGAEVDVVAGRVVGVLDVGGRPDVAVVPEVPGAPSSPQLARATATSAAAMRTRCRGATATETRHRRRLRCGAVPPADGPPWVDGVVASLHRHGFHQVAHVPDAGHAELIRRCQADPGLATVALTSEEQGVALAAGAWLGGQRVALLVQSSGVGNCVNLFSLVRTCRVPLLLVVTMRGQYGEANPWQVPMGQATAEVLRLSGFVVLEVDEAERVAEVVEAAATMVASGPAAAVLVGQRAVGAKSFDVAAAP